MGRFVSLVGSTGAIIFSLLKGHAMGAYVTASFLAMPPSTTHLTLFFHTLSH